MLGKTVHEIERILSARVPVELPLKGEARNPATLNAAAVALILSYDAARVLLIKRAAREGDPWSGHMSFPGGRHEEHDTDTGVPSLRQTAERETWEEVGLMLSDSGRLIGRLDDQRAHTGSLLIRPFVFQLEVQQPNLVLDANEVAAMEWAAIADMRSEEKQTRHTVLKESQTFRFPGIQQQEGIVWGLTYRMLQQFFYIGFPTK